MEGSLVGLQVIIGDKGFPAEDALVPGPGQQGNRAGTEPLELEALKTGPHLALSPAALKLLTPPAACLASLLHAACWTLLASGAEPDQAQHPASG